jgi:hypothetical protein
VYESPVAISTPVDDSQEMKVSPEKKYLTEKQIDNTGWQNRWNSVLDAISAFSDAVVSSTTDSPNKLKFRPRHGTLRDMVPRMPWHDIHAFVGGIAARDIASHFIQVK